MKKKFFCFFSILFRSKMIASVAYLRFQKGGKSSLATNVHTMGGQTKFSNFFQCQKKILSKGAMAQCPPKYASG